MDDRDRTCHICRKPIGYETFVSIEDAGIWYHLECAGGQLREERWFRR